MRYARGNFFEKKVPLALPFKKLLIKKDRMPSLR